MTNAETTQLLLDLVTQVMGAQGAVVVGEDGLLEASYARDRAAFDTDDAEQLAAVAQGMWSLGRGTGQRFDGGDVRQIAIEMDNTWLFITGAGDSRLAVLASDDVDAGMLTYEAVAVVKKIHTSRQAVPQ